MFKKLSISSQKPSRKKIAVPDKLFQPGSQTETLNTLIEVASQAKSNLVLLPGLNLWDCVDKSDQGRPGTDRHAGSWTGKLVQDWMRLPGLRPDLRSCPRGKDLP